MSHRDSVSVYKGAYSQYQELHKEQLRLLSEVHRVSSQGFKARARVVTKENERRRRALEQKKEAFAKAEVERRKEALELRRKGQKEATMRFKSVFKKPPTSTKSQISRKAQDTKGVETRTHAQPRLAYGHETEVLEVVATNKSKIPSVDDLLKSLRGPTAQSHLLPSDSNSTDSGNKVLTSQESQSRSVKEENVNNNAAAFSGMFNRRCSLSDTEILNRQLSNERVWSTNNVPFRIESPCRINSPRRTSSPRRIGSPRRSGSCDNFNFRALKKGSVAEEVLKELQCDSSLVQSSLDNNKVYPNVDLSDSLNISGTALNDSLEKPVCSLDSAEGAWVDSYHSNQDTSQNTTIGMDNSVLSIVSASESSSQVAQGVVERPSILKTSRFGMHKDSYSENFHGSCNKAVKKVRFQDQPSTLEVQTYITRQPSYLSQVPTFQMPISRPIPYKSHYSKSHSQTHHYSSNSTTTSPKHDSGLPTPLVSKSSASTLNHPGNSNDLDKSHNLPTTLPTDEDISNLWSEIRSYFRENNAKSQNGLRLISVENSGYLTQGTNSRFPNTSQRGTIRTNPVTHLSRSKQATLNRTDSSDQVHKSDSRQSVSPVQITFNNSLLRTKEMKTSGSNELLLKEKRLQQSLDKLNSRLRDNGPGGSKPGSVTNKKTFTSPMTKDSIYTRVIHHRSSPQSYFPSNSY